MYIGFVKNRSILDNLFSFWEVVALAKCTNNKVVGASRFLKSIWHGMLELSKMRDGETQVPRVMNKMQCNPLQKYQ